MWKVGSDNQDLQGRSLPRHLSTSCDSAFVESPSMGQIEICPASERPLTYFFASSISSVPNTWRVGGNIEQHTARIALIQELQRAGRTVVGFARQNENQIGRLRIVRLRGENLHRRRRRSAQLPAPMK